MALKLFHCDDCGSEFRMSPKLVGRSDELTCPLCGEEAVSEGPAPIPDEEEAEEIAVEEGEEEEEEEEEDLSPGSRASQRRKNPRYR